MLCFSFLEDLIFQSEPPYSDYLVAVVVLRLSYLLLVFCLHRRRRLKSRRLILLTWRVRECCFLVLFFDWLDTLSYLASMAPVVILVLFRSRSLFSCLPVSYKSRVLVLGLCPLSIFGSLSSFPKDYL